jgi:hypothetical protein
MSEISYADKQGKADLLMKIWNLEAGPEAGCKSRQPGWGRQSGRITWITWLIAGEKNHH